MKSEFYKVTLDGLCLSEDFNDIEIFDDKNTALNFITDTYKNNKEWEIDSASIYKCQFENNKLVEVSTILDISNDEIDALINKPFYDLCNNIEAGKYDFEIENILDFTQSQIKSLLDKMKNNIFNIREDLDYKLKALELCDKVESLLKDIDYKEGNKNIIKNDYEIA